MVTRKDGWVRIGEWDRYHWLRHGFSTRQGGWSTIYAGEGEAEMNLGLTREDDPGIVERNRQRAAEAIGGHASGAMPVLATVRQVHGTEILAVAEGGSAGIADGMITGLPGVLLGIMVADCVPILLADTRRRVVGAFHAGWRGTAAGIAGLGVARMLAEGSAAADLIAAVGPSIGPCCYQVGEEVRAAFGDRGNSLFHDKYLDLWEANRRQLVQAGVAERQVSVTGECTSCARREDGRRRYFSHLADRGVTGRAMGIIGVAPAG